ncbi:MFS transporter [Micropruina sp.]|uniref:MFS transporter n=1 Tax=Micropruina sp. TaxID=2737536 RepID=UPI0039E2AE5B
MLLVAVLIAVFVVPLSVSGTAVALADIAASLGESAVGQQWALNGFNITFAASTLAWGSLADRIGRWVSFQLGVVVFIAGSVVSVLAPNYLILDAARILAGLGAGAVFSVGSALLSVVYTGTGRARVFSLLGAMAGLALAFGPTICGFLTGALSWQAIFAIQGGLLSISLVLMLGTRGLLHGEPRSTAPFDWPAAILFFIATASLVAALVTGSDTGWVSAPVIALVAVTVFAFAALMWWERRTEHPLLDFALIRHPRFLGVTLVVAVASFTFAAIVTYTPALVQAIYGLTPAGSGMFVMFMTLPTLAMPLIAGALVVRKIPARNVLTVSVILMAAGAGLVAAGAVVSVWLLAPAMMLLGAGFGMHAGLVDNEGLAAAPDEDAGMAAGWINTIRVGTEAIAVALFGAIFIPALTTDSPASAFSAITLASTILALLLAIISIHAMRRHSEPD